MEISLGSKFYVCESLVLGLEQGLEHFLDPSEGLFTLSEGDSKKIKQKAKMIKE